MMNRHRNNLCVPVFLSVLGACWAFLGSPSVLLANPTPQSEQALTQADKDMETARKEVQDLKDAWDKTRLEATLYDQRAKRAYQKWIKSAKSMRAQAQSGKERADLEFELAVEKRKLAYAHLQEALFRQAATEAKLQALDQEKDEAAILGKMKEIEAKLTPANPSK